MNSCPVIFRFLLLSAVMLGLGACADAPVEEPTAALPPEVSAPAEGQAVYNSPGDASKALQDAAGAKDLVALRKIFGPRLDDLLSGDDTQDAVELENFSDAIAQMCNPVEVGDNKVMLYLGDQNWPFPIPLVLSGGPQWFFDTAAGRVEILNRRIGLDEMTAISVCRAYGDAQRDYAAAAHDDSGVLKYAQRLNSNEGEEDGLYWEPVEGEDLSPLGPLVANAHEEGYDADRPIGRTAPYHGYLFKILKEQGPEAAGGKYHYVINGHMVAGFALVAYPAHWGESGIMTFIINQNGKIFQRNLGVKSAELAATMESFNPGPEWAEVTGDGVTEP